MIFSLPAMGWFLPIITVVIGIIIKKLFFTKPKSYWKDVAGIPHFGREVTGNPFKNLYNKVTFFDTDKKIYDKLLQLGKPFGGIVQLGMEQLYLIDLDMIRLVLVKHFDHFVNRKSFNLGKNDAHFTKLLFNMEGDEWRGLRAKISPTFTTLKIKRMFSIFNACAKKLATFFEKVVAVRDNEGGVDLDVSEGLSKFTMDVIASSAFGVDCGAFDEKLSLFEKMGEKLQLKITLGVILKFLVLFTIPTRVSEWLGIRMFDAEADEFFTHVILRTLRHRAESGVRRDDFLQLMIEARNDQLKIEEGAELDVFEKEAMLKAEHGVGVNLDDDVIVANSILFLLAGFETTQALLVFAVYQLALSPQIQQDLFLEVQSSLAENDGEFSYDSVNRLELLDKVISETLRMYPPATRLERKCTKDYKLPNCTWSIKKDQIVVIPIMSIQRDPRIYPDPDKFDPERFSAENKAKRHPYSMMTFGIGPRNCLGMRFALIECKLALAHLVNKFIFEPCVKTDIPITFKNTASLKRRNGMWLKMKGRK